MPILSGSSYASFTVQLSKPATETVTLEWKTVSVTAVPGEDYAETAGTVIFLPSETVKVIQVLVYGRAEGDDEPRNFRIELTPAPNIVLGDATADCTISLVDAEDATVARVTVAQGRPGLSAYEIAKLQGFEGTAQEWVDLNSSGASWQDAVSAVFDPSRLHMFPGDDLTDKLQQALDAVHASGGGILRVKPRPAGMNYDIERTVIIPGNVVLDGVTPLDYWGDGDPPSYSGPATVFRAVGAGNGARWYDEDGITDRTDYRPMFVLGGRGAGIVNAGTRTETGNPWDCAIFNPGLRQIRIEHIRDRGDWNDAALRMDATWSPANTTLTALHPEIQADGGSLAENWIGKNIWRGRRCIKIQGARRNPADFGGVGQPPWVWGGNGISDTHFELQMLRPSRQLPADYDDPSTWSYGLWIDYPSDNAAQAAQGLTFDYLAIRIGSMEGMIYCNYINRLEIRGGYSESNTNVNPASATDDFPAGQVARRCDFSVHSTKVEIHGDFGSNHIWYNAAGTGNALDAVDTGTPLDAGNAGIPGLSVYLPDGTRHVGDISYGSGISPRIDNAVSLGSSSRGFSRISVHQVRSYGIPLTLRGQTFLYFSASDTAIEGRLRNDEMEWFVPNTVQDVRPDVSGQRDLGQEGRFFRRGFVATAPADAVSLEMVNAAWTRRYVQGELVGAPGKIYPTVADGLADSVDGDNFYARPASSDTTFADYWYNDDGTAVYIDSLANTTAYSAFNETLNGQNVFDRQLAVQLQFGGTSLVHFTHEGRCILGPIAREADGSLIEWRAQQLGPAGSSNIYVTAPGMGHVIMTRTSGDYGYVDCSGPVLSYYEATQNGSVLRTQVLAKTTIGLLDSEITEVRLAFRLGQSNGIISKTEQITMGLLGEGRILTFSGGRGILSGFGEAEFETWDEVGELENAQQDMTLNNPPGDDPPLGYETPLATAAKCYIENSPDNIAVVAISHARGGSFIHQSYPGTPIFENMMVETRKAASQIGMTGRRIKTLPIFINNGEQDRLDPAGVFKAKLVYLQAAVSAGIKTATLESGEIILVTDQMSNWTAYGMATCAVPLDQLAAARENVAIACMGPNYQHFTSDGIHKVSDAAINIGFMEDRVARHIEAGTWTGPLEPLSAVPTTAQIVDVIVRIPVEGDPIEINTDLITDPGDYGVVWVDGAGALVDINTVAVTADDKVRVTTLGAPAPGGYIGFADRGTPGTSAGPTTGPRCCIRSTAPGLDPLGNPAHYHMCHSRIAILAPEEDL